MSTVEDGWDDDDGFFGLDDEGVTGNGDEGLASTNLRRGEDVPRMDEFVPSSPLQISASSVPPPSVDGSSGQSALRASKVEMEISENASDGWGDDDDALQFDDDDEEDDHEQPINSRSPAAQPDLSVNSHPVTAKMPSSAPAFASPSTVDDPLYMDLVAYIGSLEHLSSSINAILEAEYNESQDKAMEILEYYRDRPGLAAYTVDKELSRMEYVVTIPPAPSSKLGGAATTITDKAQIANLLRQPQLAQGPSLLARCANQSILADLLQVCTGHDRLVRPQYMASATAQACRFHLDFVSGRLFVEAHLSLSIPTASGRWEVAHIAASVEFQPREHDPSVRYRLEKIQVLTSPNTDPLFQQRATSALDVLREFLHDHPPASLGESEATDLNFRDTFLQQSQNILLNSADGMQSAWKEFEQVAGIKSKLMNLPGFLPDDVLNAAEQETFTVQAEQQERQRQPQEQERQQQRPKSILGGLVRSGFKKLAQQVALPTEDPSIYEDWSSSAKHPPTTESVVASHPVPHHQSPQTPQLQLYNKPEWPSPKLHTSSQFAPADDDRRHKQNPGVSSPKEYQSFGSAQRPPSDAQALATGPVQPSVDLHPSFEDGWGDEEDDLFEIEEKVEDVASSALDEPTTDGFPSADAPPASKSAAERPRYLVDESKQVPPGWTYDPTTGIIPTRKRWTNPCIDPCFY